MVTERWCRVTMVGSDGDPIADAVLEGSSAPDLSAVDELARLALLAKRLGAHLQVAEVTPEFADLIELTGLCVEMERQPEIGEEAVGIQQRQEEGHAGDPASRDLEDL
jgi:hypothetical protein